MRTNLQSGWNIMWCVKTKQFLKCARQETRVHNAALCVMQRQMITRMSMISIVSNAKSLYVTTTMCSTPGGLVRLAIVRIVVRIWRVNRPELSFYDFYFFMVLQLEFLNFFSRCVYFDLAIRVLITTVPGHTASFHACSMLVPTIPKSMEASSTVATYLELSWCN